ncbi:MAG: tyrosine-type recombinase/integrase [Actinomycetota bacterium]|nr:tyrosine-type recombinase/integrase [Actinomycetota bacterium]
MLYIVYRVLDKRYKEKNPDPDDLVFATKAGTPVDSGNFVQREFEPLLKEAGVKRIRFHDLRHPFASLAIKAGVNSKLINQIMGHSSITITMDRYAHIMPWDLEDTVRRMEMFISRDKKVIPFLTRRSV